MRELCLSTLIHYNIKSLLLVPGISVNKHYLLDKYKKESLLFCVIILHMQEEMEISACIYAILAW